MEKIVDFLQRLSQNNNREWFNANKDEYLRCKMQFDEIVNELIVGIHSFDPSIGSLGISDCTYRIYRDVRFSQDKSPYKTHFGAFIAPGGKKSGFAGYYMQIGAYDHGFPGGCMLATGDYCCEPRVLKLIREDIDLDSDGVFDDILKKARGFKLDYTDALKKVPAGYPKDHPKAEYLRLKNYCLVKDAGLDYMLKPDLAKRLIADFKKTKPFLDFINRAIAYTREV